MAVFPSFRTFIITQTFNYEVSSPPNWLWYSIVQFFYSWYTFLAIGVAGVWALAAKFAKIRRNNAKRLHYPMVSFIFQPLMKKEAFPAASEVFSDVQKNTLVYAKSSSLMMAVGITPMIA